MENEKTIILEMIRENKITVDEGLQLLNALNKNNLNLTALKKDLKDKLDSMPKPDTDEIKKNLKSAFYKTKNSIRNLKKNFTNSEYNQTYTPSDFNNQTDEPKNNNLIILEPLDSDTKTSEDKFNN